MDSITITYVISDIDKALAFEWIVEEFDKTKFKLHFILLNKRPNCYFENWLKSKNIPVYYIHYEGKKHFLWALYKVRKVLANNKTKIIHCHFFEPSLIGLLAAKSLGITKRIYTRHYSTLHHEYYPRAVYYDKLINFLATDVVAISKNVQNVLIEKEKVNPKKIHLIHHGFKLELFENVPDYEVEELKRKYMFQHKYPVIGVIARWTFCKGIQYIIPAFKQLLKIYPNAYLVLANTCGDYTSEIKKLLAELPLENYTEILFEKNIAALYKTFTLYIHTPINPEIEAFGQTYVEALAAGVPCIFTLSGVAHEFIEHERNALVVNFCDSLAIFEAMQKLLFNRDMQEKLKVQGKSSIKENFGLNVMINKLKRLYE
jgi:glycosyltransferase involved in cell wall biosynthesis